MSTRFCIERVPMGKNGILYNVKDSYFNLVAAQFKAAAPLDPAQNEETIRLAEARCSFFNELEDFRCATINELKDSAKGQK